MYVWSQQQQPKGQYRLNGWVQKSLTGRSPPTHTTTTNPEQDKRQKMDGYFSFKCSCLNVHWGLVKEIRPSLSVEAVIDSDASAVCKLPSAYQQNCCKMKLTCCCSYWLVSATATCTGIPLQVSIRASLCIFPCGGGIGWGCYEFITLVPCWPSYSVFRYSNSVTVKVQQCSLTLHALSLWFLQYVCPCMNVQASRKDVFIFIANVHNSPIIYELFLCKEKALHALLWSFCLKIAAINKSISLYLTVISPEANGACQNKESCLFMCSLDEINQLLCAHSLGLVIEANLYW